MNKKVGNSTAEAFNIFISYRRDDSAGYSGRLYDRLVSHFGEGRIFRDLDTIKFGENFKEAISEAISTCKVLLVVIGRQWLTSTDEAGRRLDNPNDFVRTEIAAALNQGTLVIPVLVQGAAMPRVSDLPDPLAGLSERNALELSDSRWTYDVGRLIEALEKGRFSKTTGGSRSGAKSLGDRIFLQTNRQKLLWGGAFITLIVLLGAFAFSRIETGPASKDTSANKNISTNKYIPTSPNTSASNNSLTPAQRVALEQIDKDAAFAVEFLDALFEARRNVPPIQILPQSEELINEWDEVAGKYKVEPRVRYLPDLTYVNMAHPFIKDVVNFEFRGQAGSLQMSYAAILASLIKQKRLGQTASNADWVLAEGYDPQVDEGSANSHTRPVLMSLKDPNAANSAYRHVPHVSQLLPQSVDYSDIHLNANITNKAFYETAIRIGSDDAGKIWIKTLREKLLPTSRINDLAKGTYEIAGQLYGDKSKERQTIKEAWNIVGITME